MNRDRDRVAIGDDLTVAFSGRVVDVSYANGEVRWVRLQSPKGHTKLLFPDQFPDFTFTVIPDEDFKARWSA